MPTLEEIHRHVDDAAGDDPRQALIGVRKLIEEDAPWLEQRAVKRARLEHWSWVRISRLLLRSRQAVRQRFLGIEERPLPAFETSDDALIVAAGEAWCEQYLRSRADRAPSLPRADSTGRA